MFPGPPLVQAELGSRIRSGVWTSIVTTPIEPLLVRRFLFAYMFPQTADGAPDRGAIAALLPKVEAALDVLDRAVTDGEIGADPFGRVDAFLVPILFYLRYTPEGGATLAARPQLAAYLKRSLATPSVQATTPPPLPARA